MKYLFIGLFILTFIAASVGWYTNRPSDGSGWLGSALKATGIKQKESAYRQQLRDSALIAMDQQRKIFDDIKDQRRFIEENNERLQSITQMASSSLAHSNIDITRTRVLMEDLQNQQKLLVENGKELVRMNQEQLKMRQQILAYAEADNIASNINRDRLNELSNQMLEIRARNFDHALGQTQVIQGHMQAMKEHFSTLDMNLATQDSAVAEKLRAMSEKSREMMESVEQQQQRLRERNKQYTFDAKLVKERMATFIENKRQQFNDVNDQLIERKRTLEDRTQDQLEQLKQQREYNKHR